MRRKQTYEVELRRAIRKTGVGRGGRRRREDTKILDYSNMKNNFLTDTKTPRETWCVLRPLSAV